MRVFASSAILCGYITQNMVCAVVTHDTADRKADVTCRTLKMATRSSDRSLNIDGQFFSSDPPPRTISYFALSWAVDDPQLTLTSNLSCICTFDLHLVTTMCGHHSIGRRSQILVVLYQAIMYRLDEQQAFLHYHISCPPSLVCVSPSQTYRTLRGNGLTGLPVGIFDSLSALTEL